MSAYSGAQKVLMWRFTAFGSSSRSKHGQRRITFRCFSDPHLVQ